MLVISFSTRLYLSARHRGKHFQYLIYSHNTNRQALLSLFYRYQAQLVHGPQLKINGQSKIHTQVCLTENSQPFTTSLCSTRCLLWAPGLEFCRGKKMWFGQVSQRMCFCLRHDHDGQGGGNLSNKKAVFRV